MGIRLDPNAFNDLNGITAEDVANVNVESAELNLTWGQLEETEGEIKWELIDRYIDLYKAADRKVALRLSTAYFQPDDTPRWVFNDYGVRRIYEEDYLFESFDQGNRGAGYDRAQGFPYGLRAVHWV